MISRGVAASEEFPIGVVSLFDRFGVQSQNPGGFGLTDSVKGFAELELICLQLVAERCGVDRVDKPLLLASEEISVVRATYDSLLKVVIAET